MSLRWWLDTAIAIFSWFARILGRDLKLQDKEIRAEEARTAPVLAELAKTADDARTTADAATRRADEIEMGTAQGADMDGGATDEELAALAKELEELGK